MPTKKHKNYTLKQLIKKSIDVNLNTAIALSKSLKDEEKAKIRRAKEENEIPLHLMKDSKEVQSILDARLSDIIQPFNLKLTNIDSTNKNRLWNKASLTYDICLGDLSFDNINMSELLEYYVPGLMPPISPTMIRMGDKMMNMSQIEGRERSFLFTKKSKPEERVKNDEFSRLFLSPKPMDLSQPIYNNGFSEYNLNYNEMEQSLKFLSDHEPCNEIINIEEPVNLDDIVQDFDVEKKISENFRFMKMFNNHKHSDLLLLLKSGNILFLHKFVLESWMCNESILKESQVFILDIEDEIVFKVFKHLYSDGKLNIDDIVESDACRRLCKMFGLNESTLITNSKTRVSETIKIDSVSSPTEKKTDNIEKQHLTNTSSLIQSNEPNSLLFENINEQNKSKDGGEFQIPISSSQMCNTLINVETSTDIEPGYSFEISSPTKQNMEEKVIFSENLSKTKQKETETTKIYTPLTADIERIDDFKNNILLVKSNESNSLLFESKNENNNNVEYEIQNIPYQVDSGLHTFSNYCVEESFKNVEWKNSFVFSSPINQNIRENVIISENLSSKDLFESFSQISFSVNIDDGVINGSKDYLESKQLDKKCNNINENLLNNDAECKNEKMEKNSLNYDIINNNPEAKETILSNLEILTDSFLSEDLNCKKGIEKDIKNITPKNYSITISETCPEHRDGNSINMECMGKNTECVYETFEMEKNINNQLDFLISSDISSIIPVKENLDVVEMPLHCSENLVCKRLILHVDANNSPLPLFKRIGLNTQTQDGKVTVVNISSDEESENIEIISSCQKNKDVVLPEIVTDTKTENVKIRKRKSKDSIEDTKDEGEQISKRVRTLVKKKSGDHITDEEQLLKLTKVPMKRKSKDEGPLQNQVTKITKRNSKQSCVEDEKKKLLISDKELLKPKSKDVGTKNKSKRNCVTPEKQKVIFNPFTPIPNYREMSLKNLEDQCKTYGLRSTFPREKLIDMLEKLFLHFRQVDTDTEKNSSPETSFNSGYQSPFDNLSSDSKEEDKLDDLNENVEFLLHLKQNYFNEILTYTPLDINKIHLELKENGIKTSLQKLNDFFDNQCILLINKKDKLFSRPMKASKYVL